MNEADVLRIIASLILIVLAILASAWLVRRTGLARSGGAQALRVVATQNLGNRAWVTIVEVEDARLVLGVTGQQVNVLHTLPPSPTSLSNPNDPHQSASSSDAPGFTAALSRALKRR